MDARGAAWYLSSVFGGLIEAGHHVCIYTLPDKRSRFFGGADAVSEAAKHCQAASRSQNVYACMGVYEKPPRGGRGAFNDVTGIGALWADIDVAHPDAHKKKNLPASMDQARALCEKMGRSPSFTVESGFGLHAYWLLDEPATFSNDVRRLDVQALSRRWGATLREAAKSMGLDVDMAHDLTRVLRVPGTLNHKSKPPRNVVLVAHERPPRYSLERLEEVMIAEEMVEAGQPRQSPAPAVGHLDVSAGAMPHPKKLEALRANNRKFAATLEGSRPDLQDQSPSAYDMALADYAVEAGWTDQEVCNLLIYWRRERGHEPKLRLDYYQRTIGKARSARERREASESLQASASKPGAAEPAEREKILGQVGRTIGLSLVKWIKQGKENAVYSLVLAGGREVIIGKAEAVISQGTFAARVYDAIDVHINRLSPVVWGSVCSNLGRCVEVLDNDESTHREQLLEWIGRYVPSEILYRDGDWGRALPKGFPFVRDGELHVHLPSLRKWLRVDQNERVERQQLWAMMRLSGFESTRVHARAGGARVRGKSYWKCNAAATRDLLGDARENKAGAAEAGDAE